MALASNFVWDLTSLYPVYLELVDKIQKKLPKGFHGYLSHYYSYEHVNNTPKQK